jgi:Tfp pilus assembly protein PilF
MALKPRYNRKSAFNGLAQIPSQKAAPSLVLPMNESDPIQALRDALALSPDNYPLHTLLAKSLLDQGRADLAEPEFRRILAKFPCAEAAQGLARSFAGQGKMSAAVVLLEEWADRDDSPAKLKVQLADYYLRNGETPRAVAVYKQALAPGPEV